MCKIFLSYTTRDGLINKTFLLNLEKMFPLFSSVYIDLIHNNSLDKQKRVISELKKSDILFLIKTDDTYKSEWVNKELEIAKKINIPIYELNYNKLIKNDFKYINQYLSSFI